VKHTAGPWNADAIGIVRDAAGTAVGVASHRGTRDETRANARLIAAAPDLLDACRVALEYFDALESHTRADDPLKTIRKVYMLPFGSDLSLPSPKRKRVNADGRR
jgi:hypothetical protein